MNQVWYVVGDADRILWVNKVSAERWARELFPDEDPYVRYGRIKFIEVHAYEY